MSPREILERMKVLADNSIDGDAESPHIEADKLLVELARFLISDRLDRDVWEKVLQEYERVETWYA